MEEVNFLGSTLRRLKTFLRMDNLKAIYIQLINRVLTYY